MGVGSGLPIPKALIEAHGGNIDASSEPGKGTRMWFVLPQPVANGARLQSVCGGQRRVRFAQTA